MRISDWSSDVCSSDLSGGHVRFENVVFAYDPARPILKGVDLDVALGRKLAVVGHSGAGKSTLSRLLYRFYDVTSGRITIDGQDIRSEEHTSELQSLMRISYAVFCLKKKNIHVR